MSYAEQITEAANERVAGWTVLSPEDRAALAANPTIRKAESGGYLVDMGDAFPIWREDMGAVRRLLLDRALAAAGS